MSDLRAAAELFVSAVTNMQNGYGERVQLSPQAQLLLARLKNTLSAPDPLAEAREIIKQYQYFRVLGVVKQGELHDKASDFLKRHGGGK